jgi:hypothetical protein
VVGGLSRRQRWAIAPSPIVVLILIAIGGYVEAALFALFVLALIFVVPPFARWAERRQSN